MGKIMGTCGHDLGEDGWCQQSSWSFGWHDAEELSYSTFCDSCFEELDERGFIYSKDQVKEFDDTIFLNNDFTRYSGEPKKDVEFFLEKYYDEENKL